MNKQFLQLSLLLIGFCLCGCTGKDQVPERNAEQTRMLQGIWIDEDDSDVAFKAVGDTIYYPEQDVLPVAFRIERDTLYLESHPTMAYAIRHISDAVLQFENSTGEVVRLVKSVDEADDRAFDFEKAPVEVNQELSKRDTVVTHEDSRYHLYVQINPTTFQVVKREYNDEGVGVGKSYFDNIVNLTIYRGGDRLFSSDFRKQDFNAFVPAEIMSQSVLSDIVFERVDGSGLEFFAQLCIPESAVSYLVGIHVDAEGNMRIK